MRKQRKLKKGEKRIRVGFRKFYTKIIKPKNLKSWKKDKFYSKQVRIWIPNRKFQFSKGRYKKYRINIKNELVLKRKFKVKKKKVSQIQELKKIKREVQQKIVKRERLRKQACINYINRSEQRTGLIFLSIRAITINPDINYYGLIDACRRYKAQLQKSANIKLSEYRGYEAEEPPTRLGTGEDTRLNDNRVHMELFYNGKVMNTYTL